MIFEESYTLHNGVAIPKLALALARKCTGAFGRFYKKKTRKLADRLLYCTRSYLF